MGGMAAAIRGGMEAINPIVLLYSLAQQSLQPLQHPVRGWMPVEATLAVGPAHMARFAIDKDLVRWRTQSRSSERRCSRGEAPLQGAVSPFLFLNSLSSKAGRLPLDSVVNDLPVDNPEELGGYEPAGN